MLREEKMIKIKKNRKIKKEERKMIEVREEKAHRRIPKEEKKFEMQRAKIKRKEMMTKDKKMIKIRIRKEEN